MPTAAATIRRPLHCRPWSPRSRLRASVSSSPRPCLFFFQAEDGIRYLHVTGVQTCALPIFPPTQPRPAPDEPLVFTVPPEAAKLIQPRQRLDLLVADVIRDSTTTLHIGGPFWNEEGFGLLRPVLEPALAV